MKYRFITADVFTDQPFAGNPLAVLPDAAELTDAQMAAIAREFNLSETVFVLPPDDPAHPRRLRIFTPARELPFAGHPTVGTALALCWLGAVAAEGERMTIVLEEGVGPVPVDINFKDGRARDATLQSPKLPERLGEPPAPERLADVLGLRPDRIVADAMHPAIFSAGVPFTIVPVRGLADMEAIRFDRGHWAEHLAGTAAPDVFVVTEETAEPGSHFHARMFAPSMNIDEDPATGAAVVAFAGFLATFGKAPSGTRKWVIEQGFEMGRPSYLNLETAMEGSALAAVRLGGEAVLISEGTIDVPS